MKIYTHRSVVQARRMSLHTYVREILKGSTEIKEDREGWLIELENGTCHFEPEENFKLLYTPSIENQDMMNYRSGKIYYNDIKKSADEPGLYELNRVCGMTPEGETILSENYDQLQMLTQSEDGLIQGIHTEQILCVIIDRLIESNVSEEIKSNILDLTDKIFEEVRKSRKEIVDNYERS